MRTRELERRGGVWRFEAGGECALPWPAMLQPPVASAKRMERRINLQRQVEAHKHLGHCEYRRGERDSGVGGWGANCHLPLGPPSSVDWALPRGFCQSRYLVVSLEWQLPLKSSSQPQRYVTGSSQEQRFEPEVQLRTKKKKRRLQKFNFVEQVLSPKNAALFLP